MDGPITKVSADMKSEKEIKENVITVFFRGKNWNPFIDFVMRRGLKREVTEKIANFVRGHRK